MKKDIKALSRMVGSDYSVYLRDGEICVRRKGGVSGTAFKTSPNLIRTRQNNREFGHAASQGAQLRKMVQAMLRPTLDTKVSNRMTKAVLSVIKESASRPGNRTFWEGLATEAGKTKLTGFDFNSKAPLGSRLFSQYEVDVEEGSVRIPQLDISMDMNLASEATHVRFRLGVMDEIPGTWDFDVYQRPEIVRKEVVEQLVALDQGKTDIVLQTNLKFQEGHRYLILSVCSLKECGGKFEEVKGYQYSSTSLVGVV